MVPDLLGGKMGKIDEVIELLKNVIESNVQKSIIEYDEYNKCININIIPITPIHFIEIIGRVT
jgi:hypothetical protein